MAEPTQVCRRQLRIAAGIAIDGEGALDIAADIFWPETLDSATPTISFIGLPGGSINRHYYDLHANGDTSFSFADFMAKRGMITISIDHLGVGESSRPKDGFILTPEFIARANANATQRIVDDLRSGDLIAGFKPGSNLLTIGVGHSMGSMLTVIQQAETRQHAGVALLGFSNRGLMSHLPKPAHRLIGNHDAIRAEIAAVARSIYPEPYFDIPPSPEGSEMFYGAKADRTGVEALKRARDKLLVIGGLQSMIPGSIADELDRIEMPVFLGLGDSDIAGPPHEIPASFPNSRDITLLVLPETGHSQFIFPSRRQLFERLASWARIVVGQSRVEYQ